MSNNQLEDRQEREMIDRLSRKLDLSASQLEELDWHVDEHVGNDGELYGYTVTFEPSGDPVAQEIINRVTDRQGWVQIGPDF